MALGLQMMLKSFGIDVDPEEIKAQVLAFQANLTTVIQNFDVRLGKLELRMTALESQQLVMLQTLNTILEVLQRAQDQEIRPAGIGPTERSLVSLTIPPREVD